MRISQPACDISVTKTYWCSLRSHCVCVRARVVGRRGWAATCHGDRAVILFVETGRAAAGRWSYIIHMSTSVGKALAAWCHLQPATRYSPVSGQCGRWSMWSVSGLLSYCAGKRRVALFSINEIPDGPQTKLLTSPRETMTVFRGWFHFTFVSANLLLFCESLNSVLSQFSLFYRHFSGVKAV